MRKVEYRILLKILWEVLIKIKLDSVRLNEDVVQFTMRCQFFITAYGSRESYKTKCTLYLCGISVCHGLG